MGAQQEKASSGFGVAPGSRYSLTQAEVDAVTEEWPPARPYAISLLRKIALAAVSKMRA